MKGPSFRGHGVLELTGRRMAVFGSASPTMLPGSLAPSSGFRGTPIDAHIARTQFGQLMDLVVDNNERFIVDGRGEPVVVIVSVQDFIRMATPLPRLADESVGRRQTAWTSKWPPPANGYPGTGIQRSCALVNSQF
jgi:prevent-host-death family protein